MDLFDQIKTLIKEIDTPRTYRTIDSHLSHIYTGRNSNTFKKIQENQQLLFCGFIVGSLLFYILSPSFHSFFDPNTDKQMFSKRPDKHTTGLINLRNDCFANSSLQAYSAMPGLTDYLNQFLAAFNKLESIVHTYDIKIEQKDDAKESKKSKVLDISLHLSLSQMVKKLQSTQMTSRTISVWSFLHSLEKIFNAKISRSQHDAHELTQLINETLENENIRLNKDMLTLKKTNSKEWVLKELEKIIIPEFPFSGLLLSHMRCLSCNYASKPSFSPFLMLTLPTPQKISSKLDTLLDENESESIEGYQCSKCCLMRIVDNEKYIQEKEISKYNEEEQKFIDEIFQLNDDPQFTINQDIDPKLEKYIKAYKKGGLDISNVTSTVFRKTQILKPPKIFGIHLSRSTFNGVDVTRNPCRVSFDDNLTLSIGKEFHEQLIQFQNVVQESAQIKSKVLTTDVNDMEDEEIQREDIDMKGEEEEDEEEEGNDDENESTDVSNSKTSDDNDSEDSDASSLTSTESDSPSTKSSNTMVADSSFAPKSLKLSESLNKTSISNAQTMKLKEHFKSFKFNENDVYKYKLRALIRHQGSHSQGHYECYKRKPLYVKDSEGNIYKLSPEISDDLTANTSDPSEFQKEQTQTGSNGNETRRRRASSKASSFSSQDSPDALSGEKSKINVIDEERDYSTSNLRRRFSNIMGRRPSIYQADPERANIQEIIHSGLTTPSEVLVDDPEKGYFSPSLASSAIEKSKSVTPSILGNQTNKVKMKKIPSTIKYPYWRMNDAQVTEVSKQAVLCETATVYMLYYERVDRKQIRKKGNAA